MSEMLDKQKLNEWIEGRIEVYSGPYEDMTDEEAAAFKGRLQMLYVLEMDIRAGRFDVTNKQE